MVQSSHTRGLLNTIRRRAEEYALRLVSSTYGKIYKPLDPKRQEIRLLVVEPGSGEETVVASFKYCSLKDVVQTPYETTSYVWGTSKKQKIIKVDGCRIIVPASAERVLRRFRYPDQQRVLWIDAVCINQTDTDERSSQVALMYEIYSKGSHNLIWLGEGDSTTPTAIECINRILEDMKVGTADFARARVMLYDESGIHRNSDRGLGITLSQTEMTALSFFYSSAWFQRLWIVQEATLSQENTCHIGASQYSLTSVLRAGKWLHHKFFHLPTQGDSRHAFDRASQLLDFCDRKIGVYNTNPEIGGLLKILIDLRDLRASEARDHIYGVLGLVDKFAYVRPNATFLIPDYKRSAASIFYDATMYCIMSLEDLRMFRNVLHCSVQSETPGIPTWVPDWSRAHNGEKGESELCTWLYRANGDERLDMELVQQSSPLHLNVSGFVVSEVAMCSKIMTQDSLNQRLSRTKVGELVRGYFSAGEAEQGALNKMHQGSLAMTVTAGVNYQLTPWTIEQCSETAAIHDKLSETGDSFVLGALADDSSDDKRLTAEFNQAAFSALQNRRLFTTQSGSLGLGTQTMETGDIVVILFGFEMPVILRRKNGRTRQFEYVGYCYIHGLMDGEAVAEHRTSGREDAKFVLV